MTDISQNYFAAEQKIIDLLTPALQDVHVMSSEDMISISQKSQTVKGVHVWYDGDRVLESTEDRRHTIVKQIWVVTVVTRHMKSISESRRQSGQIAIQVNKALAGAALFNEVDLLERAGSYKPRYDSKTKTYYAHYGYQLPVDVSGVNSI